MVPSEVMTGGGVAAVVALAAGRGEAVRVGVPNERGAPNNAGKPRKTPNPAAPNIPITANPMHPTPIQRISDEGEAADVGGTEAVRAKADGGVGKALADELTG